VESFCVADPNTHNGIDLRHPLRILKPWIVAWQKLSRESRTSLPFMPCRGAIAGPQDTNGEEFSSCQSVVIVQATQVVLVDGAAYSPAQARPCLLVGSKMYSAVNTSIGDVVGNLLERTVLQDDVGHRRV
jgi:hypothetical protein